MFRCVNGLAISGGWHAVMSLCRLAAAASLCALLCAQSLGAQSPDGGPALGVARISLVRGEVAVQRGESGDTIQARANLPLVEGDYLTTGPAVFAQQPPSSQDQAQPEPVAASLRYGSPVLGEVIRHQDIVSPETSDSRETKRDFGLPKECPARAQLTASRVGRFFRPKFPHEEHHPQPTELAIRRSKHQETRDKEALTSTPLRSGVTRSRIARIFP